MSLVKNFTIENESVLQPVANLFHVTHVSNMLIKIFGIIVRITMYLLRSSV